MEGFLEKREPMRGGEQKEASRSQRGRCVKGVLVERDLRGRGGSRKKQQEAIELEVWKGSWSRESCEGEAKRSNRKLYK